MSQSKRNPLRTYGSKPRKFSSTALWDGSRDVPRPRPNPLGENTNHLNERERKQNVIGGFVKGVVEWLSPKKSSRLAIKEEKGKENKLSRRRERISLSDDEEDVANTSVESNLTLIASTPKKEKESPLEAKRGIDLLLTFCTEAEVGDFTEFINDLLNTAEVKKLGEASYSEVFTLMHNNGATTVLKIVPFNENTDEKSSSSSNLDDILQELRISQAMAKIDGFADFQGYPQFRLNNISATVVRGSYPETLLSAWDAYANNKNSENSRPSNFPPSQTYCVIHLAHHGQDLESHQITTWSEAAHIFWSVVRILSTGENTCEFEHRDLHWGNILIDRSKEDEILERLLDNLNLEDEKAGLDGGWGGVKVTLIDYTLSRARVDDILGSIARYGFEDETLFEGKRNFSRDMIDEGDYQFDIYRQMRTIVSDENGANWSEYRPATNVLWLHYLANKLLYGKQLPTPVSRLSARNQSKLAGKRRGHERSFSVILEGEDKDAYEGLLAAYNKINPKSPLLPESATALLSIGRENGWTV